MRTCHGMNFWECNGRRSTGKVHQNLLAMCRYHSLQALSFDIFEAWLLSFWLCSIYCEASKYYLQYPFHATIETLGIWENSEDSGCLK